MTDTATEFAIVAAHEEDWEEMRGNELLVDLFQHDNEPAVQPRLSLAVFGERLAGLTPTEPEHVRTPRRTVQTHKRPEAFSD